MTRPPTTAELVAEIAAWFEHPIDSEGILLW